MANIPTGQPRKNPFSTMDNAVQQNYGSPETRAYLTREPSVDHASTIQRNLTRNDLTGSIVLTQRDPSVESSPYKRHLPIKNKEKVYNEWGAVLQRQDEVALQKQAEDMAKLKIRQQLYKNELDSQLGLQTSKQAFQRVEDKQIERAMLEFQNRKE